MLYFRKNKSRSLTCFELAIENLTKIDKMTNIPLYTFLCSVTLQKAAVSNEDLS